MNRVWGQGNYTDNIIFMGEAPGKDEDYWQQPFVGTSGELLDLMLFEVQIERRRNWVTNTISCRPPNNDYSSEEAKTARKQCALGLTDELAMLKANGFQILVLLGRNACSPFSSNNLRIGDIRGQVYYDVVSDLRVIPTYHPSFLARTGGKNSPYWKKWKQDFILVKQESEEAMKHAS
jgi:DNA polymerase